MTIGKQFKNFRRGHKINQSILAKWSGVNRATIWRLENGHEITAGNLEKLVSAMGGKLIIIDKDI